LRNRGAVLIVVLGMLAVLALRTDLQGFWVAEQRRDNPSSQANVRLWQEIIHTYDGGGNEGDEYGFLYTADPIKGVDATGVNSPARIAEEIVACRSRRASREAPHFNYAAAPFGGPFKASPVPSGLAHDAKWGARARLSLPREHLGDSFDAFKDSL
jgi:hypothetical protein